MNTVNLTCIGCPLGCQIEVLMDEQKNIRLITGNTCPRGEKYARKEVTAPTRIVTSSVRVYGSKKGERMVSLKTGRRLKNPALSLFFFEEMWYNCG